MRNSIESLPGSTRWDRRRRQMSVEFRFGWRFRRYIFFQEKWTLVSSHQDIWLHAVIRRKKIIYLLFFLSFFILLVRTHLRRYTFIAKITAIYRCKKHSRISKGANQRNSVLWNASRSLYHLFAFLSQRDDAYVVPWVESVTFLWLLKLIVFLNNCTIKSSEVDCLLDICYTRFF